MTAISYFFMYAFETLISFMYFSNKFDVKVRKRVLFSSFAISLLLQYSLSFLSIPYLNLAIFFVCIFLICYFCYNSKVSQSLFNSCLLAAIMLITELIIVYLSRLIFGINVTEHTTNETVLLIQSGSSKLLYFVVAFFISKYSKKENRDDIKFSKTVFLLLLPIASITLLLGIVRLTELFTTNNSIYYIFTIATILLMYSNIIVFWVHESTIKAQKENTELQLQAQKSELDTEYYSILQNQYDNSNILIHDIKRHLLSIKNLANENDCSGINTYIENLYTEYEVKNIKKYSENKLVNAIVNRYALVFKENNTDFSCDIRNIDFSFISDNDLTAILDNLLENALEASQGSEEKSVELIIYPTNVNYIAINLNNSCAVAPTIKNEKLVTTKKDSTIHGYGIKSIKRIVKNYDGNISFEYIESTNTFCVKIVLKQTFNK